MRFPHISIRGPCHARAMLSVRFLLRRVEPEVAPAVEKTPEDQLHLRSVGVVEDGQV